jgi:hypothetical protein
VLFAARNHANEYESPFTNSNAGTSHSATCSNSHFRINRYAQPESIFRLISSRTSTGNLVIRLVDFLMAASIS